MTVSPPAAAGDTTLSVQPGGNLMMDCGWSFTLVGKARVNDGKPARLAVGATAILLTPPSPSILKHLLNKDRGVQQNDSLAGVQHRIEVAYAEPVILAAGESSVILPHPPLPLVGVSTGIKRGVNRRCRRDYHFTDIPFPSLLKRLLKREGGVSRMPVSPTAR